MSFPRLAVKDVCEAYSLTETHRVGLMLTDKMF